VLPPTQRALWSAPGASDADPPGRLPPAWWDERVWMGWDWMGLDWMGRVGVLVWLSLVETETDFQTTLASSWQTT